jgi:hypothetical protein
VPPASRSCSSRTALLIAAGLLVMRPLERGSCYPDPAQAAVLVVAAAVVGTRVVGRNGKQLRAVQR